MKAAADVKKEVSIYIHIPFCISKCRYCDFNSYKGMEESIPAYFISLRRELELYKEEFDNRLVKTMFIGGGTPSIVDPKLMGDFVAAVKKDFEFAPNAEVTIECNPGTVSSKNFLLYKKAGISRISMGLQSFNDEELKTLGRIHTAEDFIKGLFDARNAGFTNINADLIFGIPGQTLKEWQETLEKAIELGLPHLSCYSLSIEEDTVFGEMERRGELKKIDDDTDRDMYHYTVARLNEAGYKHYEISNFALPGYECAHNMVYWTCGEYIGLGAGAHSYLNGLRFNNAKGIAEYIHIVDSGQSPAENIEPIDTNEQMSEFMIVGLRIGEGIDTEDFKRKFGVDINEIFGSAVEKLIERSLLIKSGNKIKLTELGFDLANQVFLEFI